MVAYGFSSLLGLVRNRLLAQLFFVNHKSLLDAYFAAFVLPDTIFQLLILGALSAAFIPVFTGALKRDKEEAWHIANSAASGILLLFLVISAGLFIFANQASRILAPSFSPELAQITAQLIRVMLAAQFFFALSSFMTGILQSHHLFILPALAPLFYNLGIIIGIIFLSPFIGIFGPAVGVVIGSFFHFLIQLPGVIKIGFRPKLSTDWRNPYVKRMLRLMPARAFTLAIGQLERDYCRCRLQQFSGRDHNLIQFRQTTLHSADCNPWRNYWPSFFSSSGPRQTRRSGKVWRNHCCHDIATAVFCFAGSRFTFSFKNSGGQIGLRIQRISFGKQHF